MHGFDHTLGAGSAAPPCW